MSLKQEQLRLYNAKFQQLFSKGDGKGSAGGVHINNGAHKFCLNVFIQKVNQCPEGQSWWAFVAQEVEHLAEVLHLLQSTCQRVHGVSKKLSVSALELKSMSMMGEYS